MLSGRVLGDAIFKNNGTDSLQRLVVVSSKLTLTNSFGYNKMFREIIREKKKMKQRKFNQNQKTGAIGRILLLYFYHKGGNLGG